MFFGLFKNQVEQWQQETQYEPDIDARSKKLYLLTRSFLNTHTAVLTPQDKGLIFSEYCNTWKRSECQLGIADTEYAESCKGLRFKKEAISYDKDCPMTAGFDLRGACLVGFYSDYIFIQVDFNGADFSAVQFLYTHFEACLMSDIKTTRKTNLNQTRFVKCTIGSNNFMKVGLCEARFSFCTIIDTQLPEHVKRDDRKPYPSFLQNLHISPKKLTAATVAHALWLTDKGSKSTRIFKSQFLGWARERNVPIKKEEIDECLSVYVMKNRR